MLASRIGRDIIVNTIIIILINNISICMLWYLIAILPWYFANPEVDAFRSMTITRTAEKLLRWICLQHHLTLSSSMFFAYSGVGMMVMISVSF